MRSRSTPCMANARWREQRKRFENGEGLKGPALRPTRANEEETAMSKSFKALGLAVSALALTCLPAAAQTKVTNEGISATEIVIGTDQGLGRSGFQRHENGRRRSQRGRRHQRPQTQDDPRG